LTILNGKDEGQNKGKTTAMNVWYFGYDFIDTILIFTKNEIVFVASEKKCNNFFTKFLSIKSEISSSPKG